MMVPSIKKAVAQRGWNPLNMNCLYHPDIISTKVLNETQRREEMERNVLRKDLGIDFESRNFKTDQTARAPAPVFTS